MESKLKALKVVDLKDILTKSATAVPAKANKQELISRILASPAALAEYNKQHSPAPVEQNEDLLAPPEEVDWNDELSVPAESATPLDTAPAAATPVAPQEPSTTTAASQAAGVDPNSVKPSEPATEDPDLEARRRRAERFGIPLVEVKKNARQKGSAKQAKAAPVPAVDPEKLKARQERFGLQTPIPPTAQKRSAPVDPAEEERLKKRAERFGIKQ